MAIKINGISADLLSKINGLDIATTLQGFDPDYQAILNYATAQGYGLPNPFWQIIENQLMINLKASGSFAKMVYFRNYRGDGSLDYKCINWKTPGLYDALRINSLVVDNNLGFASDGTSYIQAGISQSSEVLTDLRVGFFGGYNTLIDIISNRYSPIIAGQISFSLYPYNFNGDPIAFFNGLENATGGLYLTSQENTQGVHIVHRNGSTDYTWWLNGIKEVESAYTGTRNRPRDIVELANNTSSTIGSPSPTRYFTDPVALTFLGNQALTDTEKIDLSNAIINYMTNTI